PPPARLQLAGLLNVSCGASAFGAAVCDDCGGRISGRGSAASISVLISRIDRLNSRIPLPSPLPSSGKRFAPKMSSSTTITKIISPGPSQLGIAVPPSLSPVLEPGSHDQPDHQDPYHAQRVQAHAQRSDHERDRDQVDAQRPE